MDFNQVMKEMQKKIEDMQKKCIGKELQGISGGGQVSVVIEIITIGGYRVKKVNIELECMKNEDKDIVEDLVAAAFNDAIKKAEEEIANVSSDLVGALPPGFKLPSF